MTFNQAVKEARQAAKKHGEEIFVVWDAFTDEEATWHWGGAKAMEIMFFGATPKAGFDALGKRMF